MVNLVKIVYVALGLVYIYTAGFGDVLRSGAAGDFDLLLRPGGFPDKAREAQKPEARASGLGACRRISVPGSISIMMVWKDGF